MKLQRYALEADLTTKVNDYLDLQLDLFYFKVSDSFNKGISDILACVRGIFVAIELKADDGTASIHQVVFIEKTIAAGGVGGICYCVHDVQILIRKAREMTM